MQLVIALAVLSAAVVATPASPTFTIEPNGKQPADKEKLRIIVFGRTRTTRS